MKEIIAKLRELERQATTGKWMELLDYVERLEKEVRHVVDFLRLSQEENERLRGEMKMLERALIAMLKDKNHWYEECERLRDALEFYADQDNHRHGFSYQSPVITDGGKIARQALQRSDK